ncbi:hypothetical protein CZ814_01761 [Photobacterium toruni]|uniref:Uncharacterized protein n=1 Tax=Photobacterium toruni TaxID=1935446 RepID=A0A1T4SU43_9GAMM|nr:hypothetical protein CZ814_01761 [Photobacterium toruni]
MFQCGDRNNIGVLLRHWNILLRGKRTEGLLARLAAYNAFP